MFHSVPLFLRNYTQPKIEEKRWNSGTESWDNVPSGCVKEFDAEPLKSVTFLRSSQSSQICSLPFETAEHPLVPSLSGEPGSSGEEIQGG